MVRIWDIPFLVNELCNLQAADNVGLSSLRDLNWVEHLFCRWLRILHTTKKALSLQLVVMKQHNVHPRDCVFSVYALIDCYGQWSKLQPVLAQF